MIVYISGSLEADRLKNAESFARDIDLEPVSTTARDIQERFKLITKCEGIYLLDEWQESKESQVEYAFAKEYDLTILFENRIIPRHNILKNVERSIFEVAGLQMKDYVTNSRKRKGLLCKILFAYYASREGLSRSYIAEVLKVHESTVRWYNFRYIEELKQSKEFRIFVEKIEQILI